MVRGASFIVVVPVGLLDRHLIDQAGALAPLIDGEEDVADVDYDRTLEVGSNSISPLIASQFPSKARPNTRPFLSKTGYRSYRL